MPAQPTIIFAGGGTGGHVFPALAIAQAVGPACASRGLPQPRCIFLCSDRPLDARLLASHDHHPMPAQPFRASARGLLRFVASWGPTVRSARSIIRSARAAGPVVVVSTGGFVAAPVVQAAWAERVPVAMCALDAVEGKANRWIERKVHRMRGLRLDARLIAPNVPSSGSRIVRIGPILRSEAVAPSDQPACKETLGVDPGRLVLAIVGGSSGARSLNTAITHWLADHRPPLHGWHVIHQASDDQHDALHDAYRRAGVSVEVRSLLDPIGVVWGAADVVVSRAGAGSVAELAVHSVPCVLMPYPHHRDQHQARNAQPLADAGLATIVLESPDPAGTAQGLAAALAPMLTDPAERARRRAISRSFGPPDGARRAAEAIVSSLLAPATDREATGARAIL